MNKTEINIFFIVAAFLLGAVITFFIFTLTKKDCEICEKCEEFKIGEEVKLPLEEENVFDLLYDYASKMYEKKEYEKLNKNKDGMYYATLSDIDKLNYDVSSLGHCAQNYPLVYFDVNNTIVDKYQGYPIQIVIKCTN